MTYPVKMINNQPDYEAEYPHTIDDDNIMHYRGFSTFPDYSTAWGDEIDGISTFVCRTVDLNAAKAESDNWTVMSCHHPMQGDEKGYKQRPYFFVPATDRLIAEAEQNLADSDLSDDEKDEVRALWESYGWYA